MAASGEGLNVTPPVPRTNDECSSCGGGASQRPFHHDLLRKAITLDDPLIPEKEARTSSKPASAHSSASGELAK
jgi:hypothetical protein